MLVWLDLETTGLSSDKEQVLEVAVIVTDDSLNEVARMQRIVYYKHAVEIVEMLERLASAQAHADVYEQVGSYFKISPYVVGMHDKNGLWKECIHGLALDTVDRDLAAFVGTHGIELKEDVSASGPDQTKKFVKVTPQLAGSTISFDRAFIDAHLPRLAKTLHYRNLDVSTLNEIAKRFWKPIFNIRPNAGRAKEDAAHRGMNDIEESIETLKHYLANLSPVPRAIEAP